MEMSRAEAERTKKFCDDAAYTAKEAVTAGTVAIGAAAIYSSGLGEVLTVAGAVIATTSTIAHGANVQEQVSGNNFLKDLVFDGDQKSYEKFQMGLALAEGAVAIAAISAQAKNNLKTKIKNKGKVARASSVRNKLLNKVKNPKLKNAINEIYRPGAKTGDGGLADAVRYELKTGKLVGGKSHIQKARERVKNLENIIKKQNLCSSDLKIAKELLKDLKNALGGK